MPNSVETIETRQEAERLFVLDAPIAAGGSITLDVRKVAGYGVVAFLGISDRALSIVVEEANEEEGPFVVVATLTSSVVGSNDVICSRVEPCGSFMKITVSNPSGTDQTRMDLVGLGIPIGG
jgi:hypothetical protein